MGRKPNFFAPPQTDAKRASLWADRYGPWILSVCLHVVLLCAILMGIQMEHSDTAPPKHIRISFANHMAPMLKVAAGNMARDLVPFPSPAGPVPVPPPPIPPNAKPPVANIPAGPVNTQGAPQPRVEKASTTGEGDGGKGDVIGAGQEARIRRIVAGLGKSITSGRQALNEGRQGIHQRLENAAMQVAAYPHFPGYKGARMGAVRTLTFDNVPPEVAREVMARYDIRVTTRYAAPTGGSFLSSAASNGSVYTPTDKPGYYDVFEISPKACQQMVVLEQNWLLSRGYDTSSTYVDTVEFGIVRKAANFWDLGILKMNVQQLAQLGHPSFAPAAPPPTPTPPESRQAQATTPRSNAFAPPPFVP